MQTTVGEIAATNAIPALLMLKPAENNIGAESPQSKNKWKDKENFLDKNYLTGLQDWGLEDQKRGMGSHTGIQKYICYV